MLSLVAITLFLKVFEAASETARFQSVSYTPAISEYSKKVLQSPYSPLTQTFMDDQPLSTPKSFTANIDSTEVSVHMGHLPSRNASKLQDPTFVKAPTQQEVVYQP